MKGKELSSFLRNCFKEKLSSLGYKKSGAQFTHNDSGFTYRIAFASRNYGDCFPTSFSCWGGFLIIDRIVLLARNQEEKIKILKHGSQLFLRQESLYAQGKYPCATYDIYTLEQAEVACNEIINYFLNIILHDMREIDSFEKLFEKLNSKEYLLNNRFLSSNLNNSLILAKLLGMPNYEKLKEEYRVRLKDWTDWYKNDFEKLIFFLDNHSKEELNEMGA